MSELSPLTWRLRRCLLSVGRPRIQLAELWSCLLGVAPELVDAPDRRNRLRRALDELAQANWLALPEDARGYDRREPPLPRSIEVLQPSERTRRLGDARRASWHPTLVWAGEIDLTPRELHDLLRINHWVGDAQRTPVIVPPRERSLELFGAGNEDRLHELAATELFGPQRLTWELLSCAPVPPPFVWSAVGPGSTLLAVSGHETFASVRRALVDAPSTEIGIVAHGAGGYFASSVPFAHTLDRTVERILYFGDLAATDLDTPRRADHRAVAAELPPVEPATPLYDLLLAHGVPSPAPPLPVEQVRTLTAWLPPHTRDAATRLLVGGRRLAQEWVGYRLLRRTQVFQPASQDMVGPRRRDH